MSTRTATGVNTDDPTVPRLLEGIYRPPGWTEDAACREYPTELFFANAAGDPVRDAKRVCAMCPVIEECRDYADLYETGALGTETSYGPWGIYGGLSPRERLTRRRQQHIDSDHQEAS